MDTLDDKHRLAIGDKLSFRILEDLDDPKEPLEPKPLFVTDSGDIEIPYIGRVPAESKTCKQLAYELEAALEKEYYYQATVILAVDYMTKSRGRVYLVGAVHMPGPQEIPSDEVLTLSKGILRAGGFTDYADRHDVKVTRKPSGADSEKRTFSVDVGEIFDKGKTELDRPLEPGDLIYVPERLIRF
jgi:polysaccharide export outer membrane protein